MAAAELGPKCAECYSMDGPSQTEESFHWNLTTEYTNRESILYDKVPASVSYFIGFLMIAIFILGLAENATVLFVYAKSPKLRKANMSFVIGLALSDAGQTVFNIPFVAVACFYRKWIFGHSGCMYIGFITTWFGLSQISLLCIIALERYFIIVHQSRKLSASGTRTVLTIVACFVYGAGWAIGPLLGWSEYKLVAGEISCSLSWTLKSNLYTSYVLSLFSFVWFIPLSIIAFAYIRIAHLVYRGKEKRRSMSSTKMSRERKVAVTVLLMVGAFVISWTPYSIVALMTAFGDMKNAPSGVYLVPAAFAKASIIWNPIIYIARHKDFRRAFKRARRHLLDRLHTPTTSPSSKGRSNEPFNGSINTKSLYSNQDSAYSKGKVVNDCERSIQQNVRTISPTIATNATVSVQVESYCLFDINTKKNDSHGPIGSGSLKIIAQRSYSYEDICATKLNNERLNTKCISHQHITFREEPLVNEIEHLNKGAIDMGQNICDKHHKKPLVKKTKQVQAIRSFGECIQEQLCSEISQKNNHDLTSNLHMRPDPKTAWNLSISCHINNQGLTDEKSARQKRHDLSDFIVLPRKLLKQRRTPKHKNTGHNTTAYERIRKPVPGRFSDRKGNWVLSNGACEHDGFEDKRDSLKHSTEERLPKTLLNTNRIQCLLSFSNSESQRSSTQCMDVLYDANMFINDTLVRETIV